MSQSHTDYTSRFAIDPVAAAAMGTDELRHNFHIDGLFQSGRISLTYTHYDRMIVGGAVPIGSPLQLEAIKPTGTKGFLDRRELIAVNIGGVGVITTGGQSFELQARDMLYLGMGTQDVSFASADEGAGEVLSAQRAGASGSSQPADPHRRCKAPRSWQQGCLQRAFDLPVHPCRWRKDLPAGGRYDPAGAGLYLEHHALPCA